MAHVPQAGLTQRQHELDGRLERNLGVNETVDRQRVCKKADLRAMSSCTRRIAPAVADLPRTLRTSEPNFIMFVKDLIESHRYFQNVAFSSAVSPERAATIADNSLEAFLDVKNVDPTSVTLWVVPRPPGLHVGKRD
jgi:hypothetical protein